jgi:hypothetical protein
MFSWELECRMPDSRDETRAVSIDRIASDASLSQARTARQVIELAEGRLHLAVMPEEAFKSYANSNIH